LYQEVAQVSRKQVSHDHHYAMVINEHHLMQVPEAKQVR